VLPHPHKVLFIVAKVWCRRTDELVDGPNASHITPSALDRWEARLEDLFAGRPYDMFDAALSDTVSRFPVDIQACNLGILHTSILCWSHCYRGMPLLIHHNHVGLSNCVAVHIVEEKNVQITSEI